MRELLLSQWDKKILIIIITGLYNYLTFFDFHVMEKLIYINQTVISLKMFLVYVSQRHNLESIRFYSERRYAII